MNVDSLSTRLLARLRSSFPDLAMKVGQPPDPVAVIQAIHPDVGDVEIYDDGEELTIGLGNFTHAHVGSGEESKDKVVEFAVDLLRDLFSDTLVLWGSHSGAGGYYRKGQASSLAKRLSKGGTSYVWSGPLSDRS
jgi:hypothetical protein